MAIVVVGKDTSAVKRKTCYNCASLLEYVPSDTEQYNFSDYTGPDWQKAIICPTCQKVLRV